MENTVAQRLEALSKLQSIDSSLDEIKKVRGALPEEVMDLEDEIAGLETRLEKFNSDLKDSDSLIASFKAGIKESEKLIKKYQDQQMNVRNNREYDAITKEIELQNLEILIFEKKIKETVAKIENKKTVVEETSGFIEDRKKDLEAKKEELEQITTESEGEEQKLLKEREKASKNIEERLLNSYNKVRGNMRNGLAVVPVKRSACGGCFNIVPPQKQAEIRDQKKLIVCEHCGRVLFRVDDEIVNEIDAPKVTRKRKTTTTKKKTGTK